MVNDMTDTTTGTTTQTVDTYLAMWNEDDLTARAALIEKAWTPGGRYSDPVQEAQGHAALSAMVDGIHSHYPGQRFRRTTAVDTHHDEVLFGWELGVPGGDVTVAGIDVGILGADGRLERIIGFFGDLAQADAV
jgi:hypothetical protein